MPQEKVLIEIRSGNKLLRTMDGDELLAALRQYGLTKVDTIRFLREHCGFELARAKEIVHLIQTWVDARSSDDAFHEALDRKENNRGQI